MRVVHYLNQFFAGIGGEDRADTPPTSRRGPVGPGLALRQALGADAEVVGTVICGDGLFADRSDDTVPEVVRLIEGFEPDVVVAGPAFNAGRYGLACGRVCQEVAARLGQPAVAAMYPENAAVEVFRGEVIIVPSSATAVGMKEAIHALARLALKLGRGGALGPAAEEGYLPRGPRMNTRGDRSASARALDMLLARRAGAPFTTEVPLPQYDRVVPPAPVTHLSRMRLAVVTECGLVPPGNPDRLEWVRASKWLKYSLEGKDDLGPGEYEVVHSGYDAAFALQDPDRLVPLDALRELVRRRELGSLLDAYYVTCGNHGVLSQMAQHAREIAADLRRQHVDTVLLVAT
ncbi:MAG: glycine/betaine/sarcosine/D-proline family reductase selenoprotein B [Candidatus Rokubacteria bacterium]|nr:glycine/betaine/sarcosine/D-proline family reductase selenoprotein B [Candidatus Rokubacteria bacterium]